MGLGMYLCVPLCGDWLGGGFWGGFEEHIVHFFGGIRYRVARSCDKEFIDSWLAKGY